jgi:hypothetical protein
LDFSSSSGTAGPILAAGRYWVDVEVTVDNTSSALETGYCSIAGPAATFGTALAIAGTATETYSASGVLDTLTTVPTLLSCQTSGASIVTGATWWVSPLP